VRRSIKAFLGMGVINKSPSQLDDKSRILIILTGALGDVIRGLAVASAIKQQLPGCTLHWLIDKRWKGILALHSSIDSLLVFDRKAGLKGWFRFAGLLRHGRYDLVLDMQRILKSGIFSWLSRAQTRVGFHKKNSKEYNFLFNNSFIEEQVPNKNKLEHYLTFLTSIGLQVPSVPDFGLQKVTEKLKLPDGFTTTGFIAVVLSSTWDSKDWPLSGYVELCKLLSARETAPIVIVGTAKDIESANQIISQVPSVVSICGQTGLEQLLAVLNKAIAVVGPDSGPAHLAAAVQTPYVALFGPTPPERVGPYGMDDLVVRSTVGCMPCYRRKCPGLDKICMRLISAEAVYAKLNYAIEGRRP
jgi:heptosyltransferase I